MYGLLLVKWIAYETSLLSVIITILNINMKQKLIDFWNLLDEERWHCESIYKYLIIARMNRISSVLNKRYNYRTPY